MVLPLIPIIAVAGASLAGGAGLTAFFGAQGSKDENKDIIDSNLTEQTKSDMVAYQNGVNPNSKFQPTGEGWFSDYSQTDNSQYSEQNTTNNYYVVESPNTQIKTDTTQKTDQTSTQTKTSDNPLSSFLGGLGGSILPVVLLGVGGFLIFKEITK